MIVVLVNGIAASYYRDEPNGKGPVESVIMKELIPHVDQTALSEETVIGRVGFQN